MKLRSVFLSAALFAIASFGICDAWTLTVKNEGREPITDMFLALTGGFDGSYMRDGRKEPINPGESYTFDINYCKGWIILYCFPRYLSIYGTKNNTEKIEDNVAFIKGFRKTIRTKEMKKTGRRGQKGETIQTEYSTIGGEVRQVVNKILNARDMEYSTIGDRGSGADEDFYSCVAQQDQNGQWYVKMGELSHSLTWHILH